MRQLAGWLRADVPRLWPLLIASVLLAAGATGASVALMGTSAWLLSRAAEQPPILYLMVAIVGVRFFGISRGVLRYVERLVSHDVALRAQSALRVRVYSQLAQTTLLGRRRGDLLVRIVTDIEAVQDLIVRVLVPLASAWLVVIGTTIMLGRFSPASAVVLLVSAVLAGAVVPWLAQRASRHADRVTVPLRGDLADAVASTSSAAVDLVAYGQADQALARLRAVDDDLRAAEERVSIVRGAAAGAQVIAAALAVLGALVIGGREVAAGTLPPVQLAVLVLTPLALHEALSTLAQATQTWTRTRAALARVDEVVQTPGIGAGDLADRPSSPDPVIEVDHADIGWPGSEPVLGEVSLRVSRGERVALTGRSGVGKTTLAATVLGLIPARAGAVHTRGRIGYLAQDAHLFDTSVRENLRIGAVDADDDTMRRALARAGLDLDLDRMVGEHGSRLSGGEARRLALARVLLGRFDAWILDEPTEHLDAETAASLMDDVWSVIGDAPALVITHDPAVSAACGRTIRLDNRVTS